MMVEKDVVINKIIKLIVDEMEEEGKGNLTALYTIGVLKEAIGRVEGTALMTPARKSIRD
ncbi:hypothetical protein Amet_1922 [Alkaliphilus metalliredigens QYMF]|nr:hypothetical protein [Alkaliphilus metalliredigens]ABR48086.1 hypothetical protein Amet_1922 [Alkaliphilus metalliredigens QYMF]